MTMMIRNLAVAFLLLPYWATTTRAFVVPASCKACSSTPTTMTGLWATESSNSTTVIPRQVVEEAKKAGTSYEGEAFEVYSRDLSPKMERREVRDELEGAKVPRKPLSRFGRKIRSVLNRKTKPGKLILLRCGETTFNANGTFTGWLDPDLTLRGVQQCQHTAAVLQSEGFEPDVVYTSRLQRAIKSSWVILETMESLYLPVFKTYRLNQRMYGALQGLSKEGTAQEVGARAVDAWRNSLKARPPPLSPDDPNHPNKDRRYKDLPKDLLPSTESLLDCQERARPLWVHRIKKDIQQGKTVMVVAHRDTLRGLVKSIEGLDDSSINEVKVPKCIPFVYRFEEVKGGPKDGALRPIRPDPNSSLIQKNTNAVFLETPASLKAALAELQWDQGEEIAPGDSNEQKELDVIPDNRRSTSLKDTLSKLRGDEPSDEDDDVELTGVSEPTVTTKRWNDDASEEFEEYDEFTVEEEDDDVPVNIVSMPAPKNGMPSMFKQGEAFVVLIRHGRTPHNNLGLFTGWEDPPLATGGVEDARNAGRLLKRHNFEFDVVYTSWLTRAIQTAYYALDELDMVWLPIVKSWRLNERMYGDLTGKSKKKVANDYGEDQLKKWRRGYTIKPPPTSSYSPSYPGNDERRTKHFDDLPVSWRETVNRSMESRKLQLHRKFPKTESLADCMDRSIPFYTKQIQKEAVQKGKRVLITSHENAIRGILMHLCDIPEYAMNQLHLPNGLPLVYNVKGRCITLLDDGSGQDPMEKHDFGPAAKYLFKPCELDDDFFDSMLKKAE